MSDPLRDEVQALVRRWPPSLDEKGIGEVVEWLRRRMPIVGLGLLWQRDEDSMMRGYDLWSAFPALPARVVFGFQARWIDVERFPAFLADGWRIIHEPGGQLGNRLVPHGLRSVLLARLERGALAAGFADEARPEHAPALMAVAEAIGPAIGGFLRGVRARQQEEFVLAATDVMLVFSDEGELTFASPSASRLWGVCADELIGQSIDQLLALPGPLARLVGGPPRVGWAIVAGDRVPVEVVVGSSVAGDPSAALRVRLRDLSQIDRMQAELARTAHDHQRILDTLPTLVLRSDPEGRVFYINEAVRTLLGYSPEEIIEHPDLSRMIYAGPLPEPTLAQFRRHLDAGEPVPWVDLRCRHRDDREVLLSATILPLGLDDARPTSFLFMAQDVTAVRRWQRQAVMADRLAALGLLAAGIGHEISNPAAYMSLGIDQTLALLDRIPGSPDGERLLDRARATLEDVRDGAARIGTMVAQLRHFARGPDAPEEGEIDLGKMISATASLVNTRLRSHARLDLRIAELPSLPMAFGQLAQVVLNLLTNAMQAIPAGSPECHRVSLSVGVEDDRLLLSVADTGSGIAPETLAHIFDPFFTTKPAGEGTGLGLAISHDLVRQLGGEITVDSAPGRGSRFTVRVPLPEGGKR